MALANWPAALPVRWRMEGYGIKPNREPLRTEMEDGPTRTRNIMSVRLSRITGTLRFTNEEYAAQFKSFWQDKLIEGTAPFIMPVFNGAALVSREVRSMAQYESTFRGAHTLVKLDLEIVNL